MTDFDYTQYPTEVLKNAMERCEDDIRETQNKVKRYNKRLALNGGKGYSNIKKDQWKDYIRCAPRFIAQLEEEIAGCKAVIEDRVSRNSYI
jgi:galactokinase